MNPVPFTQLQLALPSLLDLYPRPLPPSSYYFEANLEPRIISCVSQHISLKDRDFKNHKHSIVTIL